MQFWNIVVVLGLVESSSNGIAQLVIDGKLGGTEFGAILAGSLAHALLVELKFAGLLVQQEDVAMQTRALGRAGANVLGDGLTTCQVVAGDVGQNPVLELAELGLRSAGGIGIRHNERVELPGLRVPLHDWLILNLGGR